MHCTVIFLYKSPSSLSLARSVNTTFHTPSQSFQKVFFFVCPAFKLICSSRINYLTTIPDLNFVPDFASKTRSLSASDRWLIPNVQGLPHTETALVSGDTLFIFAKSLHNTLQLYLFLFLAFAESLIWEKIPPPRTVGYHYLHNPDGCILFCRNFCGVVEDHELLVHDFRTIGKM